MTDAQKIHQLESQLADIDGDSQANVFQKVDLLNDLAWALSDTDLKRAYTLSETAYSFANASANGQLSYPIGLAYSLRTQGYLNQRFGDYPLGLTQLLQAQEICETLQLDDALPDVFDGLAGIYFQIGNFPESLNYIYKQLEAAQRLGDKRLIANAYNNLANIYFETGDYGRAIETLHHNLQIAAEIDYKRIEFLSYGNLVETHLLAGNYEQALENGLLALRVSQAAGFELFEVYAFDLIGKAYLKLGEVEQAIPHLEKALNLSRTIESDVTESLILLNIGQAYWDMQQFDQALDYLQQGVATAQAINAKSELFKGHLLLSEIFEQQGNSAQALSHFKEHHALKELVLGDKADERLKVLQVAHDTETAKQEAEIHRLHNVELKREIEERQRREEQLRLLESVVANTKDAILIVSADPIDGQAQFIVYANEALTELTGYSQQELIGQEPRIFQGPKTDAEALQQIRESIKCHQRVRTEVINYTKTGTEIWVELDLIPIKYESEQISHWVAVRRDISQRKQIEQVLQLGQERYHLATKAAAVGVWDWNLHTGGFYLDPTIKAILGYSDEEIPNDIEIWSGYVHPDDRQAVMEAAQAHIDGQTPEYLFEHQMLHKDGSVRWILVRGKAIRDEQNNVIRMVGTDTDITERKEAEAQLQHQLEFVQALSSFSEMLLAPAESEADRRRLLSEALQPLLKPIQTSTIAIHQNFDDSELGLCGQVIVAVADTTSLSLAIEGTAQAILAEFWKVQKQQHPALSAQPDDFIASIFPWSIIPAEVTQQLATGTWVGGSITELYTNAPAFRDFLLHKHHLHALLIFPIHIDGQWWGTISMTKWDNEPTRAADDKVRPEQILWSEDEILLLGTAVEMITSTLQRWQAENQLHQMNDQLEQQVKIRTTELSDIIELLQQEIEERELAKAELQHVLVSLEQKMTARTEELATFFDLTVLAGQATNLTDVFEQALPRVLEVTRSRVICLHLVDADDTGLHLVAQQNLSGQAQTQLQRLNLPSNFQNWLQQPNDPLVTTNLPQLTILPAVFRLPEYQTYLGAQIRAGGRTEGVLSCYRFTRRGFGLDEIALVTALAEQMGMVLETHRLRQKAEEMAVLQERQRLARDLHDSVSQSLYSLALFSRAGQEAAADGDPERLRHSLTQLERNTLYALREMRLLLYELRPADLAQKGLIQAVELRLNTVERRVGLQLEVHMDEFPDISPECEVELYHIIVEAMNNIVKHAAATCLTLNMIRADRELQLRIADNGHGFDLSQTTGGLGLRNIRERVTRLNGQISIFSQPGQGTRLEAIIPYPLEEP